MSQLKEKEQLLSQLQFGINDVKNEIRKVTNTDDELAFAKRECDEKFKQYRRILNEKVLLYDQMYVCAKQLLNRDDIIIKNEEEIVRIKYDIDLSRLEMEQKTELVQELEGKLEHLKTQYKELKHDIKKLEQRAEQLTALLKSREDELD